MYTNWTAENFRRALTCNLRHPARLKAEELLIVVDIFHCYIQSLKAHAAESLKKPCRFCACSVFYKFFRIFLVLFRAQETQQLIDKCHSLKTNRMLVTSAVCMFLLLTSLFVDLRNLWRKCEKKSYAGCMNCVCSCLMSPNNYAGKLYPIYLHSDVTCDI
jgi:hypothetical protein